MTMKHHIIIITTISVVLVVLISFHDEIKKTKTKEQSKNANVVTIVSEKEKEIEIQLKKGYVYKNLFLNYDFNDGLNSWNHDKGVSLTQVDAKKCVEIIGNDKQLTRIWQTIPTVSGHVYRVSYKFKGNSSAFVFFRNVQDGEVKLFSTNPTDKWQEYKHIFKSQKNEKYQVFFSSSKIFDNFYFSDVSLIDINSEEKE